MTFKNCKYYDKMIAQDHCPFSCICDANCYFTYDKLEEDFQNIKNELNDAYNQMDYMEDQEDEIDSLNDEIYQINNSMDGLLKYAKEITSRLLKYEEIDNPFCETFGPEWAHEILLHLNNERRNLMQNIKIVCKDNKYLPQYANNTDACMDLKIVVDDNPVSERWLDNINYFTQGKETWLFPGEKRLFGTGIQVAVPENYVMLLYPRSSTGAKLNIMLANTTGVIDTGYRDEIKLCLVNYGADPVLLQDGQRIAQFMIIPRPKLSLEVVQDDDNFRNGDRGGGFGSTGA